MVTKSHAYYSSDNLFINDLSIEKIQWNHSFQKVIQISGTQKRAIKNIDRNIYDRLVRNNMTM
jgi:hypothetical protein